MNTLEERFNKRFARYEIPSYDGIISFIQSEIEQAKKEVREEMTDPIGMFLGKPISQMTREELLEFAAWTGGEINRLTKIEKDTQEYRLDNEVRKNTSRITI